MVLPESDWSEDLKMKKYYNMTLQPHLTEVTYLEKSSSGKTDILEVLKHIVSRQELSRVTRVVDKSSPVRASLTCLATSCSSWSPTLPWWWRGAWPG